MARRKGQKRPPILPDGEYEIMVHAPFNSYSIIPTGTTQGPVQNCKSLRQAAKMLGFGHSKFDKLVLQLGEMTKDIVLSEEHVQKAIEATTIDKSGNPSLEPFRLHAGTYKLQRVDPYELSSTTSLIGQYLGQVADTEASNYIKEQRSLVPCTSTSTSQPNLDKETTQGEIGLSLGSGMGDDSCIDEHLADIFS